MSAREAFGPNLRRARIRCGISLEKIAAVTKVPVDLWKGLEQNDFSRWPPGIFARAYLREYARLVGVDPEATVDEFCRWYPQGDRRALRLVREQAQIVGHHLQCEGDVPPAGVEIDRRDPDAKPVHAHASMMPILNFFLRLRRTFGKA